MRLATARQIRLYAVAATGPARQPELQELHRADAARSWCGTWWPRPSCRSSRCSGASRWPAASTTAATTARKTRRTTRDQLRAEGNDVQVGGVSAYSTLGWFNDPLISTFINYPDAELARLIFHELAHQVVYVAGDSQFNESFASAVEEAGVERWLERFGNPAMRENYVKYTARKQEFLQLLLNCRRALEQNYASRRRRSPKSAPPRRACSASCRTTTRCSSKAGAATPATTASSPSRCRTRTWRRSPPTTTSCRRSARCSRARSSFGGFYAAVRRIADLDRDERHRRLKLLGAAAAAPRPAVAAAHH